MDKSISKSANIPFYETLTSVYFRTHFLIVTLLILYVFCGEYSNDAPEYAVNWSIVHGLNFLSYIKTIRFEIGFASVYWAMAQVMTAGACFYAIALTTSTIKYTIFTQYLYYKFWAWITYILVFLHLHDANQIRTAMSACFIIYALITPTKFKNIIILTALAMMFHYSGAIILFLIPLQIAPVLGLLSIVMLGVGWNFLLNNASFFSSARLYASHGNGCVSLFNSMFLAQVGIGICSVLIWNKLNDIQKKGAYISLVGIAFYLSFRNNALLAHRMRELSMLGLIPLIFHQKEVILTYPIFIMRLGVVYIAGYNLFQIVGKLLSIYS